MYHSCFYLTLEIYVIVFYSINSNIIKCEFQYSQQREPLKESILEKIANFRETFRSEIALIYTLSSSIIYVNKNNFITV